MTLVPLEQGSPDWHKWRNEGIGSSEIASIMGMNPYQTAYELWEIKMGLRDGAFLNAAMQRGNEYEDEAREWAEDSLNLPICPSACFQDNEFPFMRASLDGCNLDKDILLEIKVPMEKTFNELCMEEYLNRYICQIQWQMMISGVSKAYFVVYSPEQQLGYTQEIEQDKKFMEKLKESAVIFWRDYQNGIPPKLCQKDFVEVQDDYLKVLCEKYKEIDGEEKRIKAVLKPLQDAKTKLKGEIVEYGDDGNFTAYGLICSRSAPRPSYDIDAMKNDGIDVEKYKIMKPEIGNYTIRVNKPKTKEIL